MFVDFWRARHNTGGVCGGLVRLLASGSPLPEKYRDHPLKGNLKGLRDCHLRPDMVVIYACSDTMIELVRVGSHSELFG